MGGEINNLGLLEQPVFSEDWHVYMQSMTPNDFSKQQTTATIIYIHLRPSLEKRSLIIQRRNSEHLQGKRKNHSEQSQTSLF